MAFNWFRKYSILFLSAVFLANLLNARHIYDSNSLKRIQRRKVGEICWLNISYLRSVVDFPSSPQEYQILWRC